MEKHRCPGCMNLTNQPVCPVCGWRQGQGNKPQQLQPGTMLQGKYVIGKALGQGGFGITYLGWDQSLDRKVAIKEFFPDSLVTRNTERSTAVQLYDDNTLARYEASRTRFLREAQALARFSNVPEIVGIYGCFEQNNTAYIVMEYIKGSNLVQYMEFRGGPLSVEETLRILKPVMAALDTVHKAGFVHRDISPDNIILDPMGGAKLLDFGAVRAVENPEADKDLTRSTEAIVKHGFAPMEQYRSRGGIGPWTDEYALCATIYYCLTGRIPPDAPARSMGEEQPDWTGIPGLTDPQRAALEKGMSIAAKDRYPSVGELSLALFPEEPKTVPTPQPEPVSKSETDKPIRRSSRMGKWYGKWLFPAAAVLVAAVVGILLLTGPGGKRGAEATLSGSRETSPAPAAEAPETEPTQKDLVMAPAGNLWDVEYKDRENQPFWGQTEYPRNAVRTVSFHAQPEKAPASAWDVSDAKDRSILAWMDGSDLHVAANGTIAPNPDASCLFASFTNLETIDFGSCFDTAKVTDMSNMFFDCRSLRALDVSDFDTTRVTTMCCMFNECSSLTDLDVSGFDTSKVTDMSFMFSGCSSLTAVDVNGFDTSKVTDMSFMFQCCNNLTALDVSGFDTSKVVNMSGMFNGCSSLTELDLSGFDTSKVAQMWYMFSFCSNLTALDVSGFDTSNVADMWFMFYGCNSLTELDLSSFDTANVTQMSDMFSGCYSLTTLDLSGFDTANVTQMSDMFSGCYNLTQLNCTDSKILAEYKNR